MHRVFLALKKAFTTTLYLTYFNPNTKTIVKADILDFTLKLILS